MNSMPHGRALLRTCAGLGIWASCFVLLYAGLSLGCASFLAGLHVLGIPILNVLLTLLWLAHVLWAGVLLRDAWRHRHAHSDVSRLFAARLTWMLGIVGLLATVVTGFPVLMLQACTR